MLNPIPQDIAPYTPLTLCPHQTLCGGCASLDIPYPRQVQLKSQLFLDFLGQHNPQWPSLVQAMIPSATNVYHRNKMEFSFGQTENGIVLGLKERGKFNTVISLTTCLLQDPLTPYILTFTRDYFNKKKCNAWNPKTHQGLLRNLAIRQSKTTHKLMVTVVVSQDTSRDLFQEFATLLHTQFGQVASIWLGIQDKVSDTAFTENMILLFGESHLEETLDTLKFKLSPTAFFQTNTHQAKILYRTISNYAELTPQDQVFDLYCGTGTIGLYLAPNCKSVIGIDNNKASIQNALQNAKENKIDNITFKTENTKNFLKFTHEKATCIIADPPRDGLVPKAIKRIVEHQAKTVIYISCNPNTMVRDLSILTNGGYSLEKMQPIDMFPNTWHLETICRLTLQ